MTEYIEREALMRRIKEIHCAECDSYRGVKCRTCWVDDTLDYIDSEPAADVAPVRHGHWNTGYFHDRVCSCCLHPDNHINYYAHMYCPNCGAKMDGGGEDG